VSVSSKLFPLPLSLLLHVFPAFLHLPFTDPLLCLTCSATLRERALSFSQTTHPFISFLVREGLIPSQDIAEDGSSTHNDPDDGEQDANVFEEVNLLDALAIGLSADPR